MRMAPADPDRAERERFEADRRYNEALTALDRAVGAAAARQLLTNDERQALGTALLVFLQQITAFVDTKDRQLLETVAVRLARHEEALEAIAELRTQTAVLHRATQMLKRELGAAPPATRVRAPSPATVSHSPALPPQRVDDVKYLGFEDRFRGSDEEIGARLRPYLPLFSGARDVVDLGCGRGEFLALLKKEGITARGVDSNREMASVACEWGLDVSEGDALAFVESLADESIGGLIATQVVEHLEPAYLVRLLDAAQRKLRPGSPIVVETINAACWLAFFSSYTRDLTHVRPIHPDTLQYLLQASGFERVTIRYSAPVPDHVRMKPVELGSDVMTANDPSARALVEAARTLNANAAILNNLLFSYLDYAAIGYRS